MLRHVALALLIVVSLNSPISGQERDGANIETDLLVSYLQLDSKTPEYLRTTTAAVELRLTRFAGPNIGLGLHGYVAIATSTGPAPGMRGIGSHLTWRPLQRARLGLIGLQIGAAATAVNVYDLDKLSSLRCDLAGRCDRLSSSYPGGWLLVMQMDAVAAVRLYGRTSMLLSGSVRSPISPWDGGARAGAPIIPGIALGFRLR